MKASLRASGALASCLRAVSALMLLSLAGQAALPLSALADGHEDPVGMMSVRDPDPVPAAGTFERLVYDYIQAFGRDDRVHKAIYASRIRRSIFAHPGSQEYILHLQYIDSKAASSPDAVYDLAKSLQLHWESQYALGLGQRRAERVRTGTKVGAIVGMAALGAAMFFRPQNAPRYFNLVRELLPLAGVTIGAGVGHAVNGFLDGNIPVSPAHVMHLGIQTDEFDYDDSHLVRDMTALSASLAAGAIVYDVLKAVRVVEAVNAAATPAKVNPYVLVGSIIVSIIVEYGVRAAIDHYEYNTLKDRVVGARNIIDWSIAAQDDGQLYTGADGLVRTATNLANYINQPITDAIRDYSTDVAKAAHDYGQDSDEYRSKLAELTSDLSSKVRDALDDQERASDDDYRAILVLGYMQNHDEQSISDLGDLAQSRAQDYAQGFERWLADTESQRLQSLGSQARDGVFRDYIRGLLDAKYRSIAEEFRGGYLPRNANHVLVEAAALLRSTGKEYVDDQADFLLSMIARNDMLLTQAARTPTSAAAPMPTAEPAQPLPPGGNVP